MDARPQRPTRALHIQGDENIGSEAKQILHQRHKSTGTLSTMLGAGGLKVAAKRTVFGDVSNTAKTIATVHDDLVAAGKSTGQENVQKSSQGQEKPAALLRPAQRSLTATAVKSILGSTFASNASAPSTTTSKGQLPDTQPLQQTQVIRPRALSKRVTTIFKDNADGNSALPSQTTDLPTVQQNAIPVPPVHQNLGARPYKSQPQLNVEQPIMRRTQSKHELVISQDLHSVGIAEGFRERVAADHIIDEKHTEVVSSQEAIEEQSQEALMAPDSAVQVYEDSEVPDRQLPLIPNLSEPEEYWEEEEEEEVYDEQGYATAHSYRSRGDNTTGGATTVLVPKVTIKVQKELAAAKQIVESSRTIEEIEDEAWDTSMVAEYGDEIFEYMRELEQKMLPNAHYMDNQAEIQWSMRSVLMDCLVQVHHRFSLLPETLFLCVNYIDRFLSCKIVSLGKLQLVGATAIFVAAKYEEINCPSVGEIVYMVDGGYTIDEILKAERFMLSMLKFELGWPGPMSFLRRISKADDYDLETRTLAKYFLEVTIMDERFVGSPPSFVAAGAHCLARMMLKKGDWSPSHVYYSGYTWSQLKPLVTMIVECCENPTKHHSAVFEKYSDRRYKKASLFVRGEMDKGFVLPSVQLSSSRPSLPSFEDIAANMVFEPREPWKRTIQVKN